MNYYKEALAQAKKSLSEGGIPIGAVLVQEGEIIGKGHNQRVQQDNPILHGEMDCMQNAGRQQSYAGATMYTTLSPCMMCTGTILQFKIKKVVIGENVNFEGNIPFLQSQGVEVELLNDEETINMMATFIKENPTLWNEDIAE
ncbi:nucleoside deaminase [Fulvivirga sediminis]|uniref:Nucleoside deaminase n=1 Tax=Fulvivirga sediminis TaxID=2803949 RepID=A0A937F8Q8_9BACT|nr:nucleoside deaminase [Fulvivirga sediminis]MBL3656098.1 nucleoside deaminase [Fulvivirga sediminis]